MFNHSHDFTFCLGHAIEGFDPNYPHADILNDIGRKPWSDYRQNEEKIHIPKTFSQYGMY